MNLSNLPDHIKELNQDILSKTSAKVQAKARKPANEPIIKTIPIKAFGKARPRVTRNGTYMPKDYERQRMQLKMIFGPIDVEGLLRLSVTAVRRIPKQTKHQPGNHCTAGPDVDNIAGAVMDSLFPDDDSKIISIYCEKIWGKEDCLIIRLYPTNQAEAANAI